MYQSITLLRIFHFFLIVARIGSLLTMVPTIGDGRVNIKVRIILVFGLSLITLPHIQDSLPLYPESSALLIYYLAAEILVGTTLGLMINIYYTALHNLGNIIAMQSNLSAATIFDPAQKEQILLFTGLITTFATASILATDSHHQFIVGTIESYRYFKAGEFLNIGDVAKQISYVIGDSFLVAFKISTPFIIVGIAILVGGGILSKLMPTLQIFFVLTPAQILVMFAVLYITINNILELVINCMRSVFT